MSDADTRTIAQFFFEIGYAACWADAMMANAQRPVFNLTDAMLERAWAIMPECCDTPEDAAEFRTKLAIVDAAVELAGAAKVFALDVKDQVPDDHLIETVAWSAADFRKLAAALRKGGHLHG